MKNGFYITSKGVKLILEPSDYIDVTGEDLIELVIPDGAKEVDCSHNQLTKLDLPGSVEYINCMNNKLAELIIPDNCKGYCDSNIKAISRTMYNRSNRLKHILK